MGLTQLNLSRLLDRNTEQCRTLTYIQCGVTKCIWEVPSPKRGKSTGLIIRHFEIWILTLSLWSCDREQVKVHLNSLHFGIVQKTDDIFLFSYYKHNINNQYRVSNEMADTEWVQDEQQRWLLLCAVVWEQALNSKPLYISMPHHAITNK